MTSKQKNSKKQPKLAIIFAKNEFEKISKSIRNANLDKSSLQKLKSILLSRKKEERKRSSSKEDDKDNNGNNLISFAFLASIIISFLLFNGISFSPKEGFIKMYLWWKMRPIENTPCVIPNTNSLQNAFMPRFDCKVCSHMENISKVSNLTPKEFSER